MDKSGVQSYYFYEKNEQNSGAFIPKFFENFRTGVLTMPCDCTHKQTTSFHNKSRKKKYFHMRLTSDTANIFFDQLSGKIESRVKSWNYKLDPKWSEHVHWTPCGWDLDTSKSYPFQMRTKSFCMELCPLERNKKLHNGLLFREVPFAQMQDTVFMPAGSLKKMVSSMFMLERKKTIKIQMTCVYLTSLEI